MAYSEGIKIGKSVLWEHNKATNKRKKVGNMTFITSIHNGGFIMVQGVNFSKGCTSIDLRIASFSAGAIGIRVDKKDGFVVGIATLTCSGEGDIWKTITVPVKNIDGIHDLYFVFKGEKNLFNFDWWRFTPKSQQEKQPHICIIK